MPCKHVNTPEGCRRGNCPFSHDESLLQSCFKQACKHPRSPEGCPLGEQYPFSHEPSSPTEPRTLKQGNSKTIHRATKNTIFAPGPRNRGQPLAVARKKYINIASGRPSIGLTTAQQPTPARYNESLSSCERHEATMSTQPSTQNRYSTVVSDTTASDQRASGENAPTSTSQTRLSNFLATQFSAPLSNSTKNPCIFPQCGHIITLPNVRPRVSDAVSLAAKRLIM
ncbi:uncharacterized protein K441DRAFT_300498 [Cenococcum geophilum 1.58]|uniref:uncharacterized protein n=1 Tax=Cenococcum geophilum 1.58 TaxID=794803 RepID=UPI00358EEFFF|nr:hypothetical protein K441DRAFT_300498 [Cenococcum geophilum 1.58]